MKITTINKTKKMKTRLVFLVFSVFLFLGPAFSQAPSMELSYDVMPSSINPGGSAQVIVNVANLETLTEVKDLQIRLSSRDANVYVTAGRNNLGTLSAASTSSAAFAIKARDSAIPGTYILEAVGSYEYGNGEDGNFKLSIPIAVAYRSALEISAADIQITPGATETLPLTIQNSGKGVIRDIIVGLSAATDYVYPIENVRNSITEIAAGESEGVTFNIRASDSAPIGIQPTTVLVTYTDAGGSTQTDSQSIAVTVVGPGTEVLVNDIESDLEPGRVGEVVLRIMNVGDVDLADLYVMIETPEVLSIKGVNERMISGIPVGETRDVTFEFDVSQDAEARPVDGTLDITYRRASGKKQITESKTIGIDIKGSVDLRVVKIDVDKEDKQMEVDIANYGNRDADAIRVDVYSNGADLGTGFTDKIKPNKHKVFRFDIPTTTEVRVEMSYKDYRSEEGEVVVEERVSLKESDIRYESADPTGGLVVLLIVAAVAYWYWRGRSKRRVNIDVSKYK